MFYGLIGLISIPGWGMQLSTLQVITQDLIKTKENVKADVGVRN